MAPVDNSQFTEEQRTEAYRAEHMAQVIRQTKALESIRGLVIGVVTLVAIVLILEIVGVMLANKP